VENEEAMEEVRQQMRDRGYDLGEPHERLNHDGWAASCARRGDPDAAIMYGYGASPLEAMRDALRQVKTSIRALGHVVSVEP
jgi:hypothetical protein